MLLRKAAVDQFTGSAFFIRFSRDNSMKEALFSVLSLFPSQHIWRKKKNEAVRSGEIEKMPKTNL